jgi:hypothetical protein
MEGETLQLWKGVDKSLIILQQRVNTHVFFFVPTPSTRNYWHRFPPVGDDFKPQPESIK